MENTCVEAFLIFEHKRSRDRAISDYKRWSNFLLCRRPPPPLLFRDKYRLQVTEAPQPSDVILEACKCTHSHLCMMISSQFYLVIDVLIRRLLLSFSFTVEVKFLFRVLRRLTTNMLTLVLLFVTLLSLLKLKTETASFGLAGETNTCDIIATKLFHKPITSPYIHYGPGNVYCQGTTSHYLSLVPPEQADYSNNCTSPCFDLQQPIMGNVCIEGVSRDSIVKCFCLTQLGQELATKGPLDAYQVIKDQYYDLCKKPALNYMLSQVFSLTSSCVTVVINESIRFLLTILVGLELHTSVSNASIFYFIKSLIFLLANTIGLLFLINLSIKSRALNKLGK